MAAAALTSAMLPIGQVSAAPMTFVVVTLQDVDGMCTPTQCSLRQAINSANKNPGRDTIAFSFTGDAIPHTIQPTKELPPIKQPVVIDGTTEPSYVLYGHPVVEIDGSRAPANA
ncbi:MAG TPA: hypothetical protein VFN76_06930, partial [Candidatus Limnocylindria bacterium]|nr:hypothetical protein [Candidatus Limnocylindria bacterium]